MPLRRVRVVWATLWVRFWAKKRRFDNLYIQMDWILERWTYSLFCPLYIQAVTCLIPTMLSRPHFWYAGFARNILATWVCWNWNSNSLYVLRFVSETQLGNFSIRTPCCTKNMPTDANSWLRFLEYCSCIKRCLSHKGMSFRLSKFSWLFNFTTFSLTVLCCYSLRCVPKLLLGYYSCHVLQFVDEMREVIWRAVRRMTCGSCFKEMVKLCFFVHFGKGYGGPAQRWLYLTQQKHCLMCAIRYFSRLLPNIQTRQTPKKWKWQGRGDDMDGSR